MFDDREEEEQIVKDRIETDGNRERLKIERNKNKER